MFQSIKVIDARPTPVKGRAPARGKRQSSAPALKAVDVLVVGKFQDASLDDATLALDTGGVIAAAAARNECTGEPGRIAEAFPPPGSGNPAGRVKRIIIVGLGKKAALKPGDLRNIAASVGRRLAITKDSTVQVDLAGALTESGHGGGLDHEQAGQAFGEGVGLLGWVNEEFKGSGTPKPATNLPKRVPLALRSSNAAFQAGLIRGVAIAQSVNLTRSLSETPPNIATPRFMADRARELAREHGLGFKLFEGDALERERFTGLMNVGKASENKPCMIRLEYTPGGSAGGMGRARSSGRKPAGAGRGSSKPVVLVGKTMTYDTGGLSLKINNSMVGMKRDKDGGCAVLGAMHAIATVIQPAFAVVALLAVAENSISDEAYRPDDILTYRNGVTVEVTNTDAEGRLVLADALCWACDNENPRFIVDLATLTGGVITALGSTYAGLFCDDDALRARLETAMALSGERWWRLPFHQEYRDMMKSPVADILNSNPNRKAHAGQGAAFLSYFVKEGIPWAHIDIAGVHVAESDAGPFIKGPTGWGVRLLTELLGSM
ncbi:MAG: leucyl aminopeptidase family protein [Phycisphaerales bacterium]|nr:leucyl aminopeptidase family protein [Phycisphaerales bacterium]